MKQRKDTNWLGDLIRRNADSDGILDWPTLEQDIENRFARMDRPALSLLLCFGAGVLFCMVLFGFQTLGGG